jgi:hypothetical protein
VTGHIFPIVILWKVLADHLQLRRLFWILVWTIYGRVHDCDVWSNLLVASVASLAGGLL